MIDGCNESFATLSDAKWHCMVAYTDSERSRYLDGACIVHIEKGKVVSVVEVIVSDGKVKFSKPTRL